jgi:hypothetical protein
MANFCQFEGAITSKNDYFERIFLGQILHIYCQFLAIKYSK